MIYQTFEEWFRNQQDLLDANMIEFANETLAVIQTHENLEPFVETPNYQTVEELLESLKVT